jgi:hypothetical protein
MDREPPALFARGWRRAIPTTSFSGVLRTRLSSLRGITASRVHGCAEADGLLVVQVGETTFMMGKVLSSREVKPPDRNVVS